MMQIADSSNEPEGKDLVGVNLKLQPIVVLKRIFVIDIHKGMIKAMSNIILYNQIATLPNELKKEVSDFVAFLKLKSKSRRKIKERKFGYAKGFFKISPDFDEPLEDFKEYL